MLKVRHDGRRSVGAGPDTNGTTTAQRRLDQRKSADAVEEWYGPQYRTPRTDLTELDQLCRLRRGQAGCQTAVRR